MIAKKDVAAELAEKMVQVLEAQRCLGGDDYPLTLRRLAELTDASAPAALILKASTLRKLFTDRVIGSKSKQLDALVALVEDAERLALSQAKPPVVGRDISGETRNPSGFSGSKRVLSFL